MDLGFRAEPADRDAARYAIEWIYRAAGLAPPRIIWCGSPRSLFFTAGLVLSPAAARDWFGWEGNQRAVRESFSPDLRQSIEILAEWSRARDGRKGGDDPLDPSYRWAPVSTAFREVARRELSAEISTLVEDSVVESARRVLGLGPVFHTARHWISEAVIDYLPDRQTALADRNKWRPSASFVLHGQHNADWVGLCDYFHDIRALRRKSAVHSAYGLLAASCGWLIPRARTCWVCERPSLVRRDDAGQLHSEKGPALVYPDGWESYYWHGVHVKRSWLERAADMGLWQVYTWPESAQRRALAELAGGWERLLQSAFHEVIDEDPDPQVGTLVQCGLGARRARFLRIRCGTGRTFALPVPGECQTARQANAWTYGLASREYELDIRT